MNDPIENMDKISSSEEELTTFIRSEIEKKLKGSNQEDAVNPYAEPPFSMTEMLRNGFRDKDQHWTSIRNKLGLG
jgi:hypothetical protein